jgi:hypothetical protein
MSKLVLDALSSWVESQPLQKVWTFLDDKGEIFDSYTYQVNHISTEANFLLERSVFQVTKPSLMYLYLYQNIGT